VPINDARSLDQLLGEVTPYRRALSLANLFNVDKTPPTDGQVLEYDSATGLWGPATRSLDALSDVVITSPATGALLYYDGSNWIDRTPVLDDNTDVALTSPAANQALVHNGTNWVNDVGTWTTISTPETLWVSASNPQPAKGNGVCVAAYKLVGKTLDFRFKLVFGSTTTFGTGAWRVTLPVSLAGVAATEQNGGSAYYYDASGDGVYLWSVTVNASGTFMYFYVSGGTGIVTGTNAPVVAAQNDVITIGARLEVA
jgi:hypothetical protein